MEEDVHPLPPRVQSSISSFRLYFPYESPPKEVPEILSEYSGKVLQLSAKQVPSATILRKTGSPGVNRESRILLDMGMRLNQGNKIIWEPDVRDQISSRSGVSRSQVESMRIILERNNEENRLWEQKESTESSQESTETVRPVIDSPISDPKPRTKLDYDDPWMIQAFVAYQAAIKGELPEILCWAGDALRIQDPLAPFLFTKEWAKSHKNRIRFSEIADIEEKISLLLSRTFWGKKLQELCYVQGEGISPWAVTLKKRIRALLEGKPDPSWNKKKRERIYVEPTVRRSPKARAERLIEVLKTIDGIFFQRYLSFPEEVWSWSDYDHFVLGNLSVLITDEFFDGELTEMASSTVTFYSQLKAMRKEFKERAHKNTLYLYEKEEGRTLPPFLAHYRQVFKQVDRATGHRRVNLIGLFSQTRGCGTPPPLIVLQSKIKFLRTVSTESEPLSKTQKGLIRCALLEVLDELPKEAFTGLSTKSRVTVSTSASWEKTRKQGGTIEAISETMSQYLDDAILVPIRDLKTGKVNDERKFSSFDTIGDAIFWISLNEVMHTPPELLRQAYVTVVKEPGKGRTVTKASACLKVILDWINKICAEPLKKGILSSTSGMGKSHHGWQFFLELMSTEFKKEIFSLHSTEEEEYVDYIRRLDEYDDCYFSSTDYEEATDQMSHEVARLIGVSWMKKCGIPPLLQGIVVATCYHERNIYFTGTGALSKIGESSPVYGRNVRRVKLVKGVLMGDPITKIVLHLVNVIARRIGNNLTSIKMLSNSFTNSFEISQRVGAAHAASPTVRR